jgi:hypothetical protein
MSATSIPYGSALARKVFGVGLFSKVQAAPGFMNMISGEMPKDGSFAARAKGQTSPDYPIVKSGDLAKGAGDSVSVDLFNILSGKPVMGDKRVSGKLMALSYSSMDVKINQTRAGADGGARMQQQRTVHNLRSIAMAGLQGYMQRLEDQTALVHLAGARGAQSTADWVVPTQADPDFAEIMVNAVKAPTKNRAFYAGAATSPATIGTTDALTLQDVSRIVSQMRESSVPLAPIRVKNDEKAWNDPLWVLFVTERQWLYMKARTGQTAWQQALRDAFERKSASVKHPLFDAYESIMWDGVLIKRLNRYAIRFNTGDAVTIDTGGADGATYTESTSTTAQPVDRAILLGAQALCKAYGKSQNGSDYFYNWSEKLEDHDNVVEIVAACMGGAAKTRFRIDNVDTDFGVATVDSYSPDPGVAAGRTLLAS